MNAKGNLYVSANFTHKSTEIKNQLENKVRLYHAFIATTLLVIGVLFYIFARPAGSTYFNSIEVGFGLDLFGSIGENIPTFLHVYAFILLSSIFIRASKKSNLVVTLLWLSIDVVFELIQHPKFVLWINLTTPTQIQELPVVSNFIHYAVVGTYDLFDIISIAVGALAGYFTLLIINYSHNTPSHRKKTTILE